MPTVYEKKSGNALKCEAVDVKELTGGKNAFYTTDAPKAEQPVKADKSAKENKPGK